MIDLKKLDRAGIRGWGHVVSMRAQTELSRLAAMPPKQWHAADLTKLNLLIQDYEQIRRRATQLGLDLSGYPLP